MSIDDFAKTLIVQLPNFAGLIICIVVLVQIILRQQGQIDKLQNRINELCGEKPNEVEQVLEKPPQPINSG